MKILITGATGLVGTKLLESLVSRGFDDIRVLTRDSVSAQKIIPFPVEFFTWNPDKNFIEVGALLNVDIIIHLAGDNIASGRWTESKKNKILNSRVKGSELLIKTIKEQDIKPAKIISSSAIGIYGDCGDKEVNDENKVGTDFLAQVCLHWEKSILNHNIPQLKAYCIRTGIVLSPDGGALQKMLPAFLAGIAGNLGNGKQYMSWIHIDDLVNQFIFLIENEGLVNIYNGTAPGPVTNNEFTKILGNILNRPTLLPIPAIVLKMIFGEMSDILLTGQNIVPHQFVQEGFQFKFNSLKLALEDILKFTVKGESTLKKYLWINKPLPTVFDFFADENNLERITPPHLRFKIIDKDTQKIEQGTMINYKLKIHGIPVKWKSLISVYDHGNTFTDIQLIGPYAKWIHKHSFKHYKAGTLMLDEVVYIIPMGLLGRILAGYFIRKDISKIFNYRSLIIKKFFD